MATKHDNTIEDGAEAVVYSLVDEAFAIGYTAAQNPRIEHYAQKVRDYMRQMSIQAVRNDWARCAETFDDAAALAAKIGDDSLDETSRAIDDAREYVPWRVASEGTFVTVQHADERPHVFTSTKSSRLARDIAGRLVTLMRDTLWLTVERGDDSGDVDED